MSALISEAGMRDILRARAGAEGLEKFAIRHGIAVSTLCEIINGRRPVTEAAANAAGYVRLPMFRQISEMVA